MCEMQQDKIKQLLLNSPAYVLIENVNDNIQKDNFNHNNNY